MAAVLQASSVVLIVVCSAMCFCLCPFSCRSSIVVENKADRSPVTEADRQAEKAMRDLITARFPEHGVFGEELGMQQPSGDSKKYLWVLDPIDGTKSFITGMLLTRAPLMAYTIATELLNHTQHAHVCCAQ